MILFVMAIHWFAQILIFLLIARAICSWFIRTGSGTAYKIYQLLSMLTEPVVAPCRLITSKIQTGMFDFSIMLAVVFVIIIRNLLINLLYFIA